MYQRLLLFLLFLLFFCVACSKPDPGPLDRSLVSVRLGMAPRDVRERFAPDCKGGWVASTDAKADDIVLEWKGDDGARITNVRFEFHLGMLVAIRERLRRDPNDGAVVEATPKIVSIRKVSDAETEITVLARDCPTHHKEAEALAPH